MFCFGRKWYFTGNTLWKLTQNFENSHKFSVLTTNITLRRGGFWNLAFKHHRGVCAKFQIQTANVMRFNDNGHDDDEDDPRVSTSWHVVWAVLWARLPAAMIGYKSMWALLIIMIIVIIITARGSSTSTQYREWSPWCIQQEYGEDQGGGRGRGPPNNKFQ